MEFGSQTVGIFANQYVGALFDSFLMLGIGVEGNARHMVKRGLLSDIARVSDDAFSTRREIAKLQIAKRGHNADSGFYFRVLAHQLLYRLGSLSAQWGYDGHSANLTGNGLQHKQKIVLGSQQCLAIQGEHQVAAILNAIKTGRTLPTVATIAQLVHQNVANHIYFMQFGTLACGNAAGTDTCRKEHIGKAINHQAVNFLRHIDVERARASHQMCQTGSTLFGDDSCRHRRS